MTSPTDDGFAFGDLGVAGVAGTVPQIPAGGIQQPQQPPMNNGGSSIFGGSPVAGILGTGSNGLWAGRANGSNDAAAQILTAAIKQQIASSSVNGKLNVIVIERSSSNLYYSVVLVYAVDGSTLFAMPWLIEASNEKQQARQLNTGGWMTMGGNQSLQMTANLTVNKTMFDNVSTWIKNTLSEAKGRQVVIANARFVPRECAIVPDQANQTIGVVSPLQAIASYVFNQSTGDFSIRYCAGNGVPEIPAIPTPEHRQTIRNQLSLVSGSVENVGLNKLIAGHICINTITVPKNPQMQGTLDPHTVSSQSQSRVVVTGDVIFSGNQPNTNACFNPLAVVTGADYPGSFSGYGLMLASTVSVVRNPRAMLALLGENKKLKCHVKFLNSLACIGGSIGGDGSTIVDKIPGRGVIANEGWDSNTIVSYLQQILIDKTEHVAVRLAATGNLVEKLLYDLAMDPASNATILSYFKRAFGSILSIDTNTPFFVRVFPTWEGTYTDPTTGQLRPLSDITNIAVTTAAVESEMTLLGTWINAMNGSNAAGNNWEQRLATIWDVIQTLTNHTAVASQSGCIAVVNPAILNAFQAALLQLVSLGSDEIQFSEQQGMSAFVGQSGLAVAAYTAPQFTSYGGVQVVQNNNMFRFG